MQDLPIYETESRNVETNEVCSMSWHPFSPSIFLVFNSGSWQVCSYGIRFEMKEIIVSDKIQSKILRHEMSNNAKEAARDVSFKQIEKIISY